MLRRIEWLEHSHGRDFVHAATRVDHLHRNSPRNGIRTNQQFPAVGHGLKCILDEVQQGSLQ